MRFTTGFELTGPLNPKPVWGLLLGVSLGAIYGALAQVTTTDMADYGFKGYLTGGGVIGLIIGQLRPLFRRRVAAGLVVFLSLGVGMISANLFDTVVFSQLELWGSAAMLATVYSVFFWGYSEEDEAE